jgi:hypothetical protein
MLPIVHAAPAAHACSCAEPTPESAFARASAVFAGMVTAIDRPFLDRLGITETGEWNVHFAVSRQWKGPARGAITVRTRVTGESCGYAFREGETYLVYVIDDMEPVTGICTGTKDAAGALLEFRKLDDLAAQSAK